MQAEIGVAIAAAAATLAVAAPADAQFVDVGKARCRGNDKVETALQGQVPQADRVTGRAAQGYACNLDEIGATGSTASDPSHSKLSAWANFDAYEHCAYYGDGNDGYNGGGGTVVMDVSDPTNPKQTAYLTTPAMQGPWESLRVNARRGLLVADHQPSSVVTPQNPTGLGGDAVGTSPLDVYDVSQDCAHPKLLASIVLPNGVGHEGWFQPDGMVYYVSGGGRVVPIDLTDPAHPKELGVLEDVAPHGGSVSDDGTRGYFCTGAAVTIYDTTAVAKRRPSPKVTEIASIDLPAAVGCQETYPLTYDGRPYFVQFGEFGELSPVGGGGCQNVKTSSFSRVNFVDVAKEQDPKLVATLMNEVAQPSNCNAVAADTPLQPNPNGAPVSTLFLYGTHVCHPDRLHNPTILACGEFFSGVRVYDIRDPLHAREIAYFNKGALRPGDPVLDMAASRPVIRPDLGQIWYAGLSSGFHVLRFAPGVYPFPESKKCAAKPDRFVEQYNLACRRTPPAVGAPAVGAPAGRAPVGTPAGRAPVCRRTLTVRLARIVGKRRLRSAIVYVNGKRFRTLKGARLRRPLKLTRLAGKRVQVRVVGRTKAGRRFTRTRWLELCR